MGRAATSRPFTSGAWNSQAALYLLARVFLTVLLGVLACTIPLVIVYGAPNKSQQDSPPTSTQSNTQDTSANRDQPKQLKPGERLQEEIRAGQTQLFNVPLASGQFARAVLEWRGIDVDVTVVEPNSTGSPDRKQLFMSTVHVRASGSLPVLILSDVTGAYTLEVGSAEGSQATGNYEVTLAEVREASTSDQSRLRAGVLVTEAETARDGASAIGTYLEALTLWQEAREQEAEAYTSQKLARQYMLAEDSKSARNYYEAAIRLRETLGNQQRLAYTLKDIAADYVNFNPPDCAVDINDDPRERAIKYFERSAQIFRQIGDLRAEGSSRYNLGLAFHKIGDTEKALQAYEAALVLRRSTQDSLGEGQTLNAIGGVYSIRGDQDSALAEFQQAFSIFEKLGDRYRQAVTKNNRGLAYHNWGDLQKAREYYYEALTAVESFSDPNEEGHCQNVSGQKARICNLEASIVDNLGEIDNSLDRPEDALRKFERSEPIRKNLNFGQELGSTLARKGYSYFLLSQQNPEAAEENLRNALKEYQKALALQSCKNDWAGKALTLTYLGMAYTSLGDWQKALANYNDALELQRKTGERRAQAITLDSIGYVYASMGQRPGDAFDNYKAALQLWQDIKDEDGTTITLYHIASAERDRGNFMAAHQNIERAIRIVESRRSELTSQQLRTYYFANKENYYQLAIDLKMTLSNSGKFDAYVAAALEANERTRARTLIESLAEGGVARAINIEPNQAHDPKVAELFARRFALQERLRAKAQFRRSAFGSKHPQEQIAVIDKEIDEINNEYDDVESRIRTLSPRYAALVKPQPLTTKEIQQQLDDKTVLLEYSLGDKRSYVWVVTPDSIKGFELAGRKEIGASAERMIRALTERNRRGKNDSPQQVELHRAQADAEYSEASAELSKMVLKPVAALLGNKRLVIVPDGALQLVPFQALPDPPSINPSNGNTAKSKNSKKPGATNDRRPLVEDHEIVYEASASVLALQRKETDKRQHARHALAVLADPVFDQEGLKLEMKERSADKARDRQSQPKADSSGSSRGANTNSRTDLTRAIDDMGIGPLSKLPHSREEAQAIMKLVPKGEGLAALGFDASRATVTSPDLSQYRIIHFATHGLADLNHPELSGIVLSLIDEQGQQQDGYLRLHEIYNLNLPADLVVLSACQTGVGKQIRGEGLIALTRGFMYAGATRVVASLWKVDDEATRDLMEEFYKQMFTNKLKPAAALWRAQIKLSHQSQWHSPYYWAGFVLQGEWK
jgi:CHAT domain-containing protein